GKDSFNEIFKGDNFFTEFSCNGKVPARTLIGDYLELSAILPKSIISGDLKNSSELKDLFFEHAGISK
ncbi:MAG: hypothetical protein SPG96_07805, partial [Succinivibrio sp.]|nr:hypothetical protein [Succinivibrio sp.]